MFSLRQNCPPCPQPSLSSRVVIIGFVPFLRLFSFHFCDYFCSIFATIINSFLFANCNRKRPEQRMGSEPQALQLQFYRIYSYKLPSRFFCPLYLVGGLVPAQAVPQFTMWACSMLPFSSHSGPICWRGALFHCRLNTRFADVTLACTLSVSIQVFCSFKILHCSAVDS